MRPRTEIALGLAALAGLLIVVAAAGRRQGRKYEDDPRRSTYVAGPRGARGYADALRRLGVSVGRYRRRWPALAEYRPGAQAVFAVLAPTGVLDGREVEGVIRLADHADLLLAGANAEPLMRCFGYALAPRSDSTEATAPRGDLPGPVWTRATLVGHLAREIVDSTSGPTRYRCDVPTAAAETLLVTANGRPAAIRLTLDGGRHITLVADGLVFSNRALRETAAGEFALGLVVGRYHRAVFDEYQHGFTAGGSTSGALLDWSGASPWGWALWQLAVVGVLALLASAVRFGRPHPAIDRRRRSPLEHVRALATALASAQGHDVAVRLIVQGLRRRMSRPGDARRSDIRPWLGSLGPHLRSPRARAAVATLDRLTAGPQRAEGVREAANAVEDVWQELKP